MNIYLALKRYHCDYFAVRKVLELAPGGTAMKIEEDQGFPRSPTLVLHKTETIPEVRPILNAIAFLTLTLIMIIMQNGTTILKLVRNIYMMKKIMIFQKQLIMKQED